MSRNNMIFYLILLGVIVFLVQRCDRCVKRMFNEKDTPPAPIINRDTTIIYEVTDTQYVPKPYKVYVPKIVKSETGDGDFDFSLIPGSDTVIYHPEDYYVRRIYSDTLPVEHGTVIIKDTVQTNRITGRQVTTDLSIPLITNTITLREKPRTIGMIGFSLSGTKTYPVETIGMDLGLLFKDRTYLGLGAGYGRDGEINGTIQYKIPIRFKKN